MMAFLRSWECLHLRSSFTRVAPEGSDVGSPDKRMQWDLGCLLYVPITYIVLTLPLKSSSSPVYRREVKNYNYRQEQ